MTSNTVETIRPGRDLGEPLVGVSYLTTKEFGRRMGKGANTIVRWAQTGRLDFCRFGTGRLLIPETELERPELAELRDGLASAAAV